MQEATSGFHLGAHAQEWCILSVMSGGGMTKLRTSKGFRINRCNL